LHDTWVIHAPDRGGRPRDVRLREEPSLDGPCPFCPGQEHQTPPEILALGRPPGAAPGRPPWRVRVFGNRYPAVTGAQGLHEVVVLSPAHERGLADLDPDAVAEVLAAVRTRMAALAARDDLAAVTFFLNAGAGAGASLSHPHGQLLATPVVPAVLRAEVAAQAAWRRAHGGCLVCHLAGVTAPAFGAAADREPAGHPVAATAHAVAVAPVASRFAWEVLLAPRQHAAHFAAASDGELASLARLLTGVCRALRAAAGDPPYNLVLHTAPVGGEDFHWHLELMPRLAPLAGFEAGTGFFINPVDPATAAAELRARLNGARGAADARPGPRTSP
jgi:UDPglucose--hexose-1-phosphate uridylyltransferase